MDELKKQIEILKFKIETELKTFGVYKELKYTVEGLTKELDDHTYDENDEKSVRTYYGWLQEFYESRILVINKSIKDNQNDSVFDNSDEDQVKRIRELEKEIESTFAYVTKNYPEFSKEYMEIYEKLKRDYKKTKKEIKSNTKKKYDLSIGVADRPVTKEILGKEHQLQEEPVFSLYGDVRTLTESFIRKLEAFNNSCKNIKVFIDNDIKIKGIIKKAYASIKDDNLLEIVRQIENNYIEGIRKSITDQFIVLGPDAIQQKMAEACERIKELTDREIEKNCFLQVIQEIDLNTPVNNIITILDYVESNHVFEEMFYKILYVLIEKEKYLLARFNEEPKLYNLLNERTIMILERMFIDKISEYDENEATAIVDRLKKHGYLYVYDKECQDYIQSIRVQSEPSFDLEERPYELYKRGGISVGIYSSSDNIKIVVSDREDLHVADEKHKVSGDKIYRCRFAFNLKEGFSDYVFYHDGLFSNRQTAINIHTGEKKYIPSKRQVRDYVNGVCIICDGIFHNDSYSYSLYNIETKEKLKFDNIAIHQGCVVDYRNGLIFLVDVNKKVVIYDSNLRLYKTFNIDDLYKGASIDNVNEGVITFRVFNELNRETTIIYYDYVNMREIDQFTPEHYNNWTYSEGLYTFPGDDGKVGYKKISGEVYLSPIFDRANPFLDNMALVKIEDDNEYDVIDRTGNFTSLSDCLDSVFKRVKERYKDVPNKDEEWEKYYRRKLCRTYVSENYHLGKYEVNDDYHGHHIGFIVMHNNFIFQRVVPLYYEDLTRSENEKTYGK